MGLLQHHAEAAAQVGLADIIDGDTIEQDTPFLHVVEAVDEVDDGGFSGSCTSHESNLLTWVGIDVDIEEHLFLRHIAKINTLKVYITTDGS